MVTIWKQIYASNADDITNDYPNTSDDTKTQKYIRLKGKSDNITPQSYFASIKFSIFTENSRKTHKLGEKFVSLKAWFNWFEAAFDFVTKLTRENDKTTQPACQ